MADEQIARERSGAHPTTGGSRRNIGPIVVFGAAVLFLFLTVISATVYWSGRSVTESSLGAPILWDQHHSNQVHLLVLTITTFVLSIALVAVGLLIAVRDRRP